MNTFSHCLRPFSGFSFQSNIGRISFSFLEKSSTIDYINGLLLPPTVPQDRQIQQFIVYFLFCICKNCKTKLLLCQHPIGTTRNPHIIGILFALGKITNNWLGKREQQVAVTFILYLKMFSFSYVPHNNIIKNDFPQKILTSLKNMKNHLLWQCNIFKATEVK